MLHFTKKKETGSPTNIPQLLNVKKAFSNVSLGFFFVSNKNKSPEFSKSHM
jgi:hypothetical protein